MSGLPFPDDEPETPESAEFRAAYRQICANGWTPIAIVVPTLGRASPKVAALALEFELPVIEDAERDPAAGIGIRYEGETLNETAGREQDHKAIDELLEDGQQGDGWRG